MAAPVCALASSRRPLSFGRPPGLPDTPFGNRPSLPRPDRALFSGASLRAACRFLPRAAAGRVAGLFGRSVLAGASFAFLRGALAAGLTRRAPACLRLGGFSCAMTYRAKLNSAVGPSRGTARDPSCRRRLFPLPALHGFCQLLARSSLTPCRISAPLAELGELFLGLAQGTLPPGQAWPSRLSRSSWPPAPHGSASIRGCSRSRPRLPHARAREARAHRCAPRHR